MEFVLVCPLYLVLLGGIMKIGSLQMTMHKLVMYDYYASLGFDEKLTPTNEYFNYLFKKDGDYEKTAKVLLSQKDKVGNIVGNNFIVQQSSGSQIKLTKTPIWWNLLKAPWLFKDESDKNNTINNQTTMDVAQDYQRSFVIKKRVTPITDKDGCLYNRTLPAGALALDYVWYNVGNDNFPMCERNQKSNAKRNSQNSSNKFYERILLNLCE